MVTEKVWLNSEHRRFVSLILYVLELLPLKLEQGGNENKFSPHLSF
jgi:hypothetical protein